MTNDVDDSVDCVVCVLQAIVHLAAVRESVLLMDQVLVSLEDN